MQFATRESLLDKASGHARLAIIFSIFQPDASRIGPDQAGIRKQDQTPGDALPVKQKTIQCHTTTTVSVDDREIRTSELEKFHTVVEKLVVEVENTDAHIHVQSFVTQDHVSNASFTQRSRAIVEKLRKVSDVVQGKALCVTLYAARHYLVVNIHVKKSAIPVNAATVL